MSYGTFKALKFERPEPEILRIVFDSPGKLNAVDREMHWELSRVWLEIDQDPEVRVVIVTGADGVFGRGRPLHGRGRGD